MTNAKLNVLLATVLDKAADDRALANRIMKRFALAQALAVEEQLSEDDTRIVAAAAALYEFNDEPCRRRQRILADRDQRLYQGTARRSLRPSL